MIRAVIDANVLVPGLIGSKTDPGRIVDAWNVGRFEVIASDHLIGEVARTLEKAYFRDRYPLFLRQRTVSILRRQAVLVQITVQVHGIAAHEEDDLVLTTAVSGRANVLVTGDRQLLKLGTYEGVEILNPRAFLGLLQSDPS